MIAVPKTRPGPSVVLRSRVDSRSEDFARNVAGNRALLGQVGAALAQSLAGGGPDKLRRHRERGKLTIRERIEALNDRDAPFLELSPLMAWGTEHSVGGSGPTRWFHRRNARSRCPGRRPWR